jgi:hypothetical protein
MPMMTRRPTQSCAGSAKQASPVHFLSQSRLIGGSWLFRHAIERKQWSLLVW